MTVPNEFSEMTRPRGAGAWAAEDAEDALTLPPGHAHHPRLHGHRRLCLRR